MIVHNDSQNVVPPYKTQEYLASFVGVVGVAALILGGAAFCSHKGLLNCKLLENALGFDGSIICMSVGGVTSICALGAVLIIKRKNQAFLEPIYEKQWQEQIHSNFNEDIEEAFRKIAKKYPPHPTQHVLLYQASEQSDLFFEANAGFFKNSYNTLMQASKILIVVRYSNPGEECRWEENPEEYFESLQGTQDQVRAFLEKKIPYRVIFLTSKEEAEIISWAKGKWDCSVPRRIRNLFRFNF